ncbi:hypothetical protein [Burkholderia ubonensis]|uniref:hypothetical protein n=1 Tax=Burkholderia ubonensis TaxID=101571 RepID=UPI000A483AC6|nr:hypothetical protein [Burkholderia ubonensis]
MAEANSKSRPNTRKPRKPNTVLAMILRSTSDRPRRGWPYMPWMSVIDAHFKLFGFEPGDRVFLDINHKTRQISITPDYTASLRSESSHTISLSNERKRHKQQGPLRAVLAAGLPVLHERD